MTLQAFRHFLLPFENSGKEHTNARTKELPRPCTGIIHSRLNITDTITTSPLLFPLHINPMKGTPFYGKVPISVARPSFGPDFHPLYPDRFPRLLRLP